MSLLEDVFLEDEAGEAQELERIIEGDEDDERPPERSDSDNNSEKEDEAEEDKRRVDPASTKTKRSVQNPRFILNPARLTGPRGIQVIPEHFKDFKFKGKGHEKEDLDLVLKKLEHWAYRLYPKFKFEDCLKKIETLGKKRPVMVHLHKIRSDQLLTEETVVQKDSSDEEPPAPEEDEFDKLIQQQLEMARSTPAPGSVKGLQTPAGDKRSPLNLVPKATSSPSISDEQKERMMRNRRLAEERRLARLTQANNSTTLDLTGHAADKNVVSETSEVVKTKINKPNIIDSSDDDDNVTPFAVNESVSVDVHRNHDKIIDISEGYERRDKERVVDDDVAEEIDLISGSDDVGRKKKGRASKVFDSDDDDNINTLPSSDKISDITEGSKKLDRSKVIPINEDSNDVTTLNDNDEERDIEDNVIDITNRYHRPVSSNDDEVMEIHDIDDGKEKERNKSDDDEIASMEKDGTSNQEMNKSNKNNMNTQQDNLNKDSDIEDDFPNTVTDNIEENEVNVVEKSKTMENNELEIENDSPDSTKDADSDTKMKENVPVNGKSSTVEDFTVNKDSGIIEDKENIDDLMDVDFGEDF